MNVFTLIHQTQWDLIWYLLSRDYLNDHDSDLMEEVSRIHYQEALDIPAPKIDDNVFLYIEEDAGCLLVKGQCEEEDDIFDLDPSWEIVLGYSILPSDVETWNPDQIIAGVLFEMVSRAIEEEDDYLGYAEEIPE